MMTTTSHRLSTSEFAISSIENLNDQISNFVFSKKVARLASINLTDEDQETLRTSFLQMRSLLDEAQLQFTKMADNNRRLAAKIDGNLNETNEQMALMKTELQRLAQVAKGQMAAQEKAECNRASSIELEQLRRENGRLREELDKSREELERAEELNRRLTNNNDHTSAEQDQLKHEMSHLRGELKQCHEQIGALKSDQKRLRAEKLDLLGQMRQLYGTLEHKETELKEFIRTYEQRIAESESIIKNTANDLAERSAALKSELDHRDQIISELEQEITHLKRAQSNTPSSTKESLVDDSSSSRTFDAADPASLTSIDTISPSLDDEDCFQTFPRSGTLRADQQRMTRQTSWPAQNDHERATSSDRSLPSIAESIAVHETNRPNQTIQANRLQPNHTTTTPNHCLLSSSHDQAIMICLTEAAGTCSTSLYLSEEEKTRLLAEARQTLPVCWKANHVRAWIELELQMSCYGLACAENIKSGRILLSLSDAELDSTLGLQSPLHRRKLRLAIEELRQPDTKSYPLASYVTHAWVSSDWLPSLGLSQFGSTFEAHLVDGRMLNVLTKKDLERHLSVLRKLHQSSILCGIELLRSLAFDKKTLAERRKKSQEFNNDLIVWTNDQVLNWLRSIDLEEYADNVKYSGINGSLFVLDNNFSVEAFAEELKIPSNKSPVVRHLTTEFKSLVARATKSDLLTQPRKSNLSRGSPFIRSFRGGKPTTDETNRQNRGSEKRFSWRGSFGRAFGKKLSKDQIQVIRTELGTAKSLSNIDDSANREKNIENDRLI